MEAMLNFLALLGWSPGNDQEVFTTDELVHAFSLEGISSSNAVFNPEKLDWINGQHILLPKRGHHEQLPEIVGEYPDRVFVRFFLHGSPYLRFHGRLQETGIAIVESF
jgi:glutamyl/glutaminyl-tRNA synthetase